MKRYNEYKDSGVEWIGEIPSHWDISKLKFNTNKEFMYGANESGEDMQENHPRYIRITDINEDGNLKNDTYVTLDNKKAKPYILEDKDILFARSGATVGKTFLYNKSECDLACFAGYLIKFTANRNKCNPRYIYYYTQSTMYEEFININISQATIQNVSAEKYKNLYNPLPPLIEQDEIVKYLDKKTSQIEKLISKKEELIETLKASKTKLISETVTKGIDKDVPMKDSGIKWIGHIPEHWEIKRLKYITDITMGQSPDSNDYNFEELGHPFLQGNAEFTERSPIPKVYCQKAKKYSRIGDILMSVRAPVGAINISNQVYGIGRGLCSINCLKINQEYMWHAIPIFIKELKINSKGTTYESVTMDDVKNMICIVPPLKEQKSISRYLDIKVVKIDEIILKTKEQIDILKKTKQKLITEVVTGKIDVTNL